MEVDTSHQDGAAYISVCSDSMTSLIFPLQIQFTILPNDGLSDNESVDSFEYNIQLPAGVKKISSRKGIKYGIAFENEYLDDDNNEISSDIQFIFAKNDKTYILDCYTLPKDFSRLNQIMQL